MMSTKHARPGHRSAWFLSVSGIAMVILALGFPASPVQAADTGGNKLESINVSTLSGNRVELQFQLSDTAPKPLSFTTSDPARIALDLPGTSIALPSRYKDVNVGAVQRVLTAEADGRTRVVIDLNSLVPYETRTEGNVLYVTLGSSTGALAKAGTQTFGPPAGSPSPATAGAHSISNVDFRRGEEGQGRVLVTLSDDKAVANVQRQGNNVVVSFPNVSVSDDLMKRFDVMDFATPVKTIDVERAGNGARIVIHGKGPFDQLAYQSDDLFAVELKPLTKEQQAERETKKFTGRRISLNFQNIDIRAVLQILADASGMNIVVSDSVKGNITLRLQNVPWDQALDIILKTKGLDTRKFGDILLVAPTVDIAANEKAELEAHKQVQELEPLHSEFIQVNYAKASDLATLLKSKDNSLLSKRGNVTVDARTNTLLVQDTSDHLADIRQLVAKLDIPVKQVLIESRVVIANNDFTRELGVRWGETAIHPTASGLVSVTGSAEGNDVIVNSGLNNLNTTGQVTPVTLPPLGDRLNVNLPAPNATGKLAVAILSSNYLVDLELSALQAEGKGEVVSSPRVITANQKEALIEQGVEIPYQQASSSGATNTQFKKAVLSLKVTPQITPDSNIIMDLEVHKDSVGVSLPSATGGQVPSIDTRDVQTQVLVGNGSTVVLGGIYETTRNKNVKKIPLLGDIPLLGFLFRDTQFTNNKAELLIFVTPKIVSNDFGTMAADNSE